MWLCIGSITQGVNAFECSIGFNGFPDVIWNQTVIETVRPVTTDGCHVKRSYLVLPSVGVCNPTDDVGTNWGPVWWNICSYYQIL